MCVLAEDDGLHLPSLGCLPPGARVLRSEHRDLIRLRGRPRLGVDDETCVPPAPGIDLDPALPPPDGCLERAKTKHSERSVVLGACGHPPVKPSKQPYTLPGGEPS